MSAVTVFGVARILHYSTVHTSRGALVHVLVSDDETSAAPQVLRHCVILTMDAAAAPRVLAPGLTCMPFVAVPFKETQFRLLSMQAQDKLRNTRLLHHAGDLSNNNSVNIYVNHMRIWQHIMDHLDGPTLVLEDDAILPAHVPRILRRVLEGMYLDGVSNYILKLQTNGPRWQFLQWSEHYIVGDHSIVRCECRPHHTSSSSAAYVIDRQAAQNMLQHALPMQMHVDVYTHHMGCVYGHINLFAFRRDLVRAHVRPSLHWTDMNRSNKSMGKTNGIMAMYVQRDYLLAVEFLENLMAGTCPVLGQHIVVRTQHLPDERHWHGSD
jgi:hypothetical protein